MANGGIENSGVQLPLMILLQLLGTRLLYQTTPMLVRRKARLYIDTIMAYFAPRAVVATLNLSRC